jgi:hypothetical protein
MTRRRPTFAQAKARYVHPFTVQHVPYWATGETGKRRLQDGRIAYHAPQYASDHEWYDRTIFFGELASRAPSVRKLSPLKNSSHRSFVMRADSFPTFPKAPQKPHVPTFVVTFSVANIRKIKMGRSVNDVRLWISFSIPPNDAKENKFTVTLKKIFHHERFGRFFWNSNAARLSCQLLGFRRQCPLENSSEPNK